jgi:putative endonuclease
MPDPRAKIASGASAEIAATRALEQAGYDIVERNYRCAAGELDIVADDAGVLAFVEVRSRGDADHGHAAEMVSARKRRQVARVAAWYVAERAPEAQRMRFDVVAITAGRVELVKDAWRL